MLKRILLLLGLVVILLLASIYGIYVHIKSDLPQLITVKDYKPLLVTQVYDRNNKKIGEFARQKRTLLPYNKIPQHVVQAFLAAEDDQFFEHSGINLQAILRATLVNIRAGRSVQGGSTITQQVAKTLLLSSEKTFARKLSDILLAIEMEKNLSKEDILYLYLNQIFFGQEAYGIEQAAQIYFRKSALDLAVHEAAVLAGLPQAPSRYNPIRNPKRAKERQIYVLNRMADVGYITKTEAKKAIETPIRLFVKENYEEFAPFYLELLRQMLVIQLTDHVLMDQGLRIYTGLDLEKQLEAQKAVQLGLKQLDKRQGYRGPLLKSNSAEEQQEILLQEKKRLIAESTPERTILPNGEFAEIVPKEQKTSLANYLRLDQVVKAVVRQVNDELGLVYVDLPDHIGVISFETMTWARKPNQDVRADMALIKKPSEALATGDVIQVQIKGVTFKYQEAMAQWRRKKIQNIPSEAQFKNVILVELDQEPQAQAALLSFDQNTEDILAMVGGYDFAETKFNRAIQAPRQTGSAFKTIVYAAALDKGYTPATPIMDAPLVFEETGDQEGQEDTKLWRPENHSRNFSGDIIMRNALVKSLNVPTVKIIEDIGVPWSIEYSRRLGIYNSLNPDFTLALGSSSVTLYEMTKAFSQLGRLGKRIRPVMVHKITDANGQKISDKISLDLHFQKEIESYENQFAERRKNYFDKLNSGVVLPPQDSSKNKSIDENFFFQDPDQLIKPTTAYLMTSMLKGVVEDRGGTGGAARALGREVAGKTGTTNNYIDAWFIGYTPQIATGVWVGFDKEKSLGKGEVGGRSALPIWVDYMQNALEKLPAATFPVPEGIVFVNIDSNSGKLATARTKNIIRQAFVEGTEPTAASTQQEDTTDFYKQDYSE